MELVGAAVLLGADIVLMKYKTAVEGLRGLLKDGEATGSINQLFLLCSNNHTVFMFKKVKPPSS